MIWLYTFYQSVLASPFFGYFTVDENYIADSGVFLWYGNTPRCLDWPATPSLLTFFVLFGVSVVYQIGTNIGEVNGMMGIFEQFDWQAYHYFLSRKEFLLAGRTIQLVVVGIILILFIRFIYQSRHDLLEGTTRHVLVFISITSYVIWFNAPVLRPEAISGSLFMYLLAQLVFTERITRQQAFGFAAMFAVILAERLLFVFVAPILLAGIFFALPQARWKTTFQAFLLVIGIFILLCPFLITDPLVVLKSFIGGILAKMQDKPMATLFNMEFIRIYFMNPVNYLVIFLCLPGAWVLFKRRKFFYLILLGNWLVFLFLVLRSAKIYDTHVLPAGVLTIIVIALGIGFVANSIGVYGKYLALVLTTIIIGSNLTEYVKFQQRSHTPSTVEAAYTYILSLPDQSRLLIHPDLELFVPKTKECLQREFLQNRDSLKMADKLNYLLGNKGNSKIAADQLPYVTRSFAFEDERLYEIQYQILLKYYDEPKLKKAFDIDVYLDNTELASHSVPTIPAIEDFKQGKYDYFITDIRLDDREPIQVFTNDLHAPYYCYKAEIPISTN
ncbi:hypothetical protein [Arundinibacter roseus]|uniref:Glycosyltransferase RgtA/B/C/D-like domain-containing protein n=1 Tax=Arundinibacter roseus TaxID=2070510 RepID=A0A4R4KA92_9BACT|nr:hypothetical protein [Arundinibacter roseus]TDB64493.1 hypothetical protein EZE20_12510 [Arundinibacter roseus]